MATTAVHHDRSGKREAEAGPFLRLLLRRRGLVLLAALLLMIVTWRTLDRGRIGQALVRARACTL